ncbi:hypothetical protein ElyMa_002791900 [Elysia marginata]|uniref:Uncharacterized protein n=1 Tax=Elysia marginata TaxID=1093978 RepID=A0AAV4HPK6_9GAST|nr:hypothetical protein ElyMa_002791900 [Elysia marginata]
MQSRSDLKSQPNTNLAKPKIPALNLAVDQVDLYLERFERHCASMGWAKQDWASCLVNLLSGEALTIFLSVDPDESKDYNIVRDTLLLRFNCTESGFRSKFLAAEPGQDENFETFLNRVKRYFDRWTDLAKAVDFDSLFFLILK